MISAKQEFTKLNVSRETIEALASYEFLLRRWNERINLVSKSSLEDLWTRHFLDSLQMSEHLPSESRKVLDLGSGAGFPGLVLAIVSQALGDGRRFTLVDSDTRKCEFLRAVARNEAPETEVISSRISALAKSDADVITARALAPLSALLGYAFDHLATGGTALFLKGAQVLDEIDDALKSWDFKYQIIPSLTDPNGCILKVENVQKR